MLHNPQYTGLCVACQNSPDCTFPRNSGRSVWQCDEFRGLEFSGERNSPEGSFPLRSGFLPEEDFHSRMGLCANCGNRGDCFFPKPEGGVWHCDEYR